jgi:integrase
MRTRHQDGWVELRGSRVRRWYGHYFLYVRDEADNETRRHVGVILGDKAGMCKWQAEEKLREEIGKATESQPRKDGSVTLKWFTEKKFIPTREGNWRAATKHGNLYDINHYILPALGTSPIKDIDKSQVASLLNRLAEKYTKSVVARVRIMLFGIFDEAVEAEYIGKNPVRKVSLPECQIKHKKLVMPEESLRRLLTAVTDLRDRLILMIGTFCAVRTSEVLGLTWKSFQGDSLLIENIAWEGKLYAGTKTDDSCALVYVPREIQLLIDGWKLQAKPQSEDDLMFPSQAGTPLTARNFLQRRIYPIVRRLGINPHLVTFQVLRRSCATRNQHHGSMKDVQTHLRHARIETTGNTYMQPVTKSVRQMVEDDIADVMRPSNTAKPANLQIN